MYPKLFSLWLLFCFLSCNTDHKTPIKIDQQNFKEVVSSKHIFSFTFDKDLIAAEKVDVWDSTEYIRFSPPIPGRYRWNKASKLTFYPDSPLPPSSHFKGKFDKLLFTQLPEEIFALKENRSFTFKTKNLEIIPRNLQWKLNPNDPEKVIIQSNLYFNYPIDQDELKNNLQVQINDKTHPFEITDDNSNQSFNLEISNVESTENKNTPIKFI